MTPVEPHGWEAWEWDETLFSGAAPYYVQGRTPYAPGLADAMRDALELDGRGRLLDVGCGPGTVALQLAHLVEHVVGLDPDQGMLDEAAREAAARRVANATWVRCRAEDLPAGLGRFRVVTFAASFHWMDRPRVAGTVRAMLEPDGAVVQVHAPDRGPSSSVPDEEIGELRMRYLGPDRRAGQGIRNTSPDGEDDVFRAAGFAPARQIIVPDGRTLSRSVDDLVAYVFSRSDTAPHLFGERIGVFESDLRALLDTASPSGSFAVELPDNVLNLWRVAE